MRSPYNNSPPVGPTRKPVRFAYGCLLSCTLLAGLLSACKTSAPPARAASSLAPLRTAADSLARRITAHAGGLEAWDALPLLRFDWASLRDGAEASRRKHLWDRRTGAYRVEWRRGADSIFVALFDVDALDAPTGRVGLNGRELDTAAAAPRLAQAYELFINDTYWLLFPLKLLDPGVRRALAPDSADTTTEVLALSFENVGLTPGDRYWLRAERETGRLVGWTYLLEEAEAPARWSFAEEAALPTPAGPLRLPTRKTRSDGARVVLTPVYPVADLPADAFTSLRPLL